MSFEFVRRPEDRKPEEQGRLDKLRACDTEIREGLDLGDEFAEMVRKRSAVPPGDWLKRAEGCGCPELKGLAVSLKSDEAAVSAALTEPWSNGMVEGAINRLKLIKRSMFGRASFRLLRARVLYAA